jgi:hypothetical protein
MYLYAISDVRSHIPLLLQSCCCYCYLHVLLPVLYTGRDMAACIAATTAACPRPPPLLLLLLLLPPLLLLLLQLLLWAMGTQPRQILHAAPTACTWIVKRIKRCELPAAAAC